MHNNVIRKYSVQKHSRHDHRHGELEYLDDSLWLTGNGMLPDFDTVDDAVLPPTRPVLCERSIGAPLLTYCATAPRNTLNGLSFSKTSIVRFCVVNNATLKGN